MTETRGRSLLERVTSGPIPWFSWMWVALALSWIVLAVVDPSSFRTQMAVVWSIIAALLVVSTAVGRRRARAAAAVQQPSRDSETD